MWVHTDRRLRRTLERKLRLLVPLLLVACTSGCSVIGRIGNGDRQRVAVLEIEGPRKAAAKARERVSNLLASDYVVVSRDRYNATARKLEARRLRPNNVAMVAAELKLTAVVHGKVVKTGRKRYAVRLRVREGLSGQVTRQIQLPLNEGLSYTKRDDALLATIDKLPPPFTLEEAPEPPDESAEEAKRAKVAERERAERDAADRKRAEREEAEARNAERERAEREQSERERAAREQAKRAEADRRRPERKVEQAPRVDKRGQVIDDEIPKHLK